MMFENTCICGEKYTPIPGLDSGHEDHEARGGVAPRPATLSPEDIGDEDD